MILFYLLVSVMPLIRHPIWSDIVGDLTMVKYVGGGALLYGLLYAAGRGVPSGLMLASPGRWFLVFSVIGLVSYATKGTSLPVEISPLLSFTSFLFLFFVTLVVVDSVRRLRWVLLVAVGSMAFASLHVLREWQKSGMMWDYRPGWVVGDPNYYTISALLVLPIAVLLLRVRQPVWERWFCIGSIGLVLGGVTVAASRGGMLGLGAAMLLVLWRSRARSRNLVVAGAVVGLVVILSPGGARLLNPTYSDRESTDTRMALWMAGARMMVENPLSGVGAGNFKERAAQYGRAGENLDYVAHNTYVEIGAELGLPGLVAFLGLLVSTWRVLERIRRSTRGTESQQFLFRMSEAMQTGLLGAAVAIVFVSAQTQKLLWLVLFLAMCLPRLTASAADTSRATRVGGAPGQGFRPAAGPRGMLERGLDGRWYPERSAEAPGGHREPDPVAGDRMRTAAAGGG